jgi:tetratricopeptide (TPR) repeat protein
MAEESRPEDEGGPAQASSNPAAWAALSAASRERADAFLERQSRLADLEIEHRNRERELRHRSLHVHHVGELLKLCFELAIGLVALLIVSALGAMVWNATQDHDLVVEAFSVPVDIAQSGMTGSVLAGRVLDRYGTMQAATFSLAQGEGSYRSSRDEQVRVEIPTTGISLGELDRYLRQWLGHETHITGDLVHTSGGLALTVRYGDASGATVAAGSGDLPKLVEQAAEHIYAAARPLRFAEYLAQNKRSAEAEAIVVPLAANGSADQRALAYIAWADIDNEGGDLYGGLEKAELATQIDPSNAVAWYDLSSTAFDLAREELSVTAGDTVIRMLREGRATSLNRDLVAALPILLVADVDVTEGDFSGAIAQCRRPDVPLNFIDCDIATLAQDEAADHDLADARRSLAAFSARPSPDDDDRWELPMTRTLVAVAEEDWPDAILWGRRSDIAFENGSKSIRYNQLTLLWPSLAYAMARTGDFAGAEALIARTALDCDECMRKRGRIAAVKHDWTGAAHWFATVSARSPSVPSADTDWGQMLLWKGDVDGAMAKFQSANRKGPHFADPLEMWGEALMQKNRSDLALPKFEEAAKYAPHWGRLHLEWGEALYYAGKTEEAKKQFAVAANLDLTSSEKAALAKDEALVSRHG